MKKKNYFNNTWIKKIILIIHGLKKIILIFRKYNNIVLYYILH